MQFTIRIDDNNFAVLDVQLEDTHAGVDGDVPEVVAARVSNSKLSDLKIDQLLDVVGQAVEFLTTERPAAVKGREPDWRESFRRGKL